MEKIREKLDRGKIFPEGCGVKEIVMAEPGKAGQVTADILWLIGLPAGGNICLVCGETSLCKARRES
ncbi:MAG: hypothetical protein A2612_00145 [Candidatus Moranbacteria bacterium RIFOXYD1_FULL_44_12]|nr:MAG: hypothetical protein A2612_00145 [Candidatus Moranbacteria bacterium RIFOXYD1_FULL_44_12]